jgi:hypothetical protein
VSDDLETVRMYSDLDPPALEALDRIEARLREAEERFKQEKEAFAAEHARVAELEQLIESLHKEANARVAELEQENERLRADAK